MRLHQHAEAETPCKQPRCPSFLCPGLCPWAPCCCCQARPEDPQLPARRPEPRLAKWTALAVRRPSTFAGHPPACAMAEISTVLLKPSDLGQATDCSSRQVRAGVELGVCVSPLRACINAELKAAAAFRLPMVLRGAVATAAWMFLNLQAHVATQMRLHQQKLDRKPRPPA